MITIFNRREILVTNSLERFNVVGSRLAENKIKYTYKVVDRNSANIVGGQRGRTGTFGQNSSQSKTYYMYVHKKDYEVASGLV